MKKTRICEECGESHDGSYGSGRFCSDHCRRVYAGKRTKTRVCNFNNGGRRAKYGTWTCAKCGLVFATRRELHEHNREEHPVRTGSSWNKGLTKSSDPRVAAYVKTCADRGHYVSPQKGRPRTEEEKRKTSASMKKFFKEHPDRVPYLLNHSSKESYPERYFRLAFAAEGFPAFEQDKYVEGYFLDFAFEESKLYVEVDGEQHFTDKNIVKHDIIRTENLNKTEWRCACRIRLSRFQKLPKSRKQLFIQGLKAKIEANKS